MSFTFNLLAMAFSQGKFSDIRPKHVMKSLHVGSFPPPLDFPWTTCQLRPTRLDCADWYFEAWLPHSPANQAKASFETADARIISQIAAPYGPSSQSRMSCGRWGENVSNSWPPRNASEPRQAISDEGVASNFEESLQCFIRLAR